jgi:hypothetical protein
MVRKKVKQKRSSIGRKKKPEQEPQETYATRIYEWIRGKFNRACFHPNCIGMLLDKSIDNSHTCNFNRRETPDIF